MEDQDKSSVAQKGAESGNGASQDPQQDKPKVVPEEDVNRLKSVYDTQVTEKNKEISGLKQALAEAQARTSALEEEKPKDQVELVKREGDLARKLAQLTRDREELQERSLKVTAKELLTKHEIKDLTVDDLVKLGSENEIELAILRKKASPVTPPPNVPDKTRIDRAGGPSGTPPGDNISDAIAKAKGKA